MSAGNTLPHTSDTREPDDIQGQTEISRTQVTDPCQCIQARHHRQRGSQQGILSQAGQHQRNHNSERGRTERAHITLGSRIPLCSDSSGN